MSKKAERFNRKPAEPQGGDLPYGGNPYRVRVIEVSMVVDVYDADGLLIGRTKTESPFAIAEAEFPAELCRFIQQRTDMKDGFYCLAPKNDAAKTS